MPLIYRSLIQEAPTIDRVWDAQLVQVNNAEVGTDKVVALAIEIPLIVLATSTVALRVYSRWGIKKKLAIDDMLIILAVVCIPVSSSIQKAYIANIF